MAAPEYDSYRKLKVLGQGAFGKALLVEDIRDGTSWVMKQIDLGAMPINEKEDTIKEAKILQLLDHPNIVKFKDVFVTKKAKLSIVMEYADGGDLGQKIKNQNGKLFSEAQILDWFTQISLALKHVHDRKIIHRDLKGQNIFLTSTNRVKLGDFGIARILGNTLDKAKTQVGTPYYLSPEIIESKPYSQASDIWSLGAILYELCTLKPPFLADSLHFLALKIIKGQFNPIPNTFSKDLNNLVKSLLQLQPTKRPNINQILKAPIIVRRIQEFLTESVKKVEFAHTIIHKQRLNVQVKLEDIKVVDEDLLRPPPNLLKQNSQSQQQLQQPQQQPQQQIQSPQQQNPIQQQQKDNNQYQPQQQFVPKQLWNQQPPRQDKPQQVVQNQQNNVHQQQRNNQIPQNQAKNAQIRNEKPLVQQVMIQQPKQYQQQQQQQQPRRDVVKPGSAMGQQKQRNNSRNRVVDAEKQEQERKRMQQIKYEADLRRKEEEKKKLLKLQQEEEAKKKFKEEQKKKREIQQKEMREDLQKKRQQLQQQSQPNFIDQEPIVLARQNYSQPQLLESELEEYNSDEETQGYVSDKKSAKKLLIHQVEHNQDQDEEHRNMDYGLKQEENQAEIDAIQQAILCKEYEKVLEEVEEANSKVNQIEEDTQFEKNRQKILDQFEVDDVLDVDDLDEDDDDLSLTKTNELQTQNTGLDYFKNPEALRSYLEMVLGKDKFQKAYTFSQNELQKFDIEQIEQRLKTNQYFKQLSYLSQEEIKQFIPLLFQLVVVENV